MTGPAADRVPRRTAVLLLAATLAGCSRPGRADEAPPTPPAPPTPASAGPSTSGSPVASPPTAPADPGFAALEAEFDARLGVFALDTGTGRVVEHRADERFAFASTYKALAAAAVLASGADPGAVVTFSAADLVAHSPVTAPRVGRGMTLAEVAEAAITVSDNTAGNLLLERLGGPAGFERALRGLGDTVTEADREEPGLNDVAPGDGRDTTSPRAFGTLLRACALGDVLDPEDRARFTGWLRATTTGDERIRAGVPAGWVVGDKTGTAGVHGNQGDIAVLWPPGTGAPRVVALFSDRPGRDDEPDPALLARAAGLVVAEPG